MKLTSVEILKYKSIESPQSISIDEAVTVLVGMNESGKTSVWRRSRRRTTSKTTRNSSSTQHMTTRARKRSDTTRASTKDAIRCTYRISDRDVKELVTQWGPAFAAGEFSILDPFRRALNTESVLKPKEYLQFRLKKLDIDSKTLLDKLASLKNHAEFDAYVATIEKQERKQAISSLKPLFENKWEWEDAIMST